MKNMIKNFRDKQSIKRIEKLCNNLGLKFFERTSGMINVYFVNRDGMYITVISDSDPLVVYRHIVQIQIHYGVLLKYNKCKDANILLFGACWDYKPFMDKICNMIANNLQSSEYDILFILSEDVHIVRRNDEVYLFKGDDEHVLYNHSIDCDMKVIETVYNALQNNKKKEDVI